MCSENKVLLIHYELQVPKKAVPTVKFLQTSHGELVLAGRRSVADGCGLNLKCPQLECLDTWSQLVIRLGKVI